MQGCRVEEPVTWSNGINSRDLLQYVGTADEFVEDLRLLAPAKVEHQPPLLRLEIEENECGKHKPHDVSSFATCECG